MLFLHVKPGSPSVASPVAPNLGLSEIEKTTLLILTYNLYFYSQHEIWPIWHGREEYF